MTTRETRGDSNVNLNLEVLRQYSESQETKDLKIQRSLSGGLTFKIVDKQEKEGSFFPRIASAIYNKIAYLSEEETKKILSDMHKLSTNTEVTDIDKRAEGLFSKIKPKEGKTDSLKEVLSEVTTTYADRRVSIDEIVHEAKTLLGPHITMSEKAEEDLCIMLKKNPKIYIFDKNMNMKEVTFQTAFSLFLRNVKQGKADLEEQVKGGKDIEGTSAQNFVGVTFGMLNVEIENALARGSPLKNFISTLFQFSQLSNTQCLTDNLIPKELLKGKNLDGRQVRENNEFGKNEKIYENKVSELKEKYKDKTSELDKKAFKMEIAQAQLDKNFISLNEHVDYFPRWKGIPKDQLGNVIANGFKADRVITFRTKDGTTANMTHTVDLSQFSVENEEQVGMILNFLRMPEDLSYDNFIKDLKNKKEEIKTVDQQLNKLQSEYQDYKKKLTESGGEDTEQGREYVELMKKNLEEFNILHKDLTFYSKLNIEDLVSFRKNFLTETDKKIAKALGELTKP